MEISFENKTVNTYREIYHQTKRTQESAESVVPDTDDDIGRIASVQPAVMLKSKDVTARGVIISGEATVTENGEARTLRPGDAEFCAGGSTHSIANHTDAPVQFLAVIVPNR